MKISEVTRRAILDSIAIEQINYAGRLEEAEFLGRIFDLGRLPSLDSRFENAAGDIWQHRVNNHDWSDDWVFHDSRFNILRGDDDLFLRFLCETVHPVVRPDPTEVERLTQLYNEQLRNDGFQLVERMRLSGRPVYVGRHVGTLSVPGVAAARDALASVDATYLAQQITRMEAAVQNDPDLAIGTAKELIESCCKTILNERGVEVPRDADIPRLVKLASQTLQLTPADIPDTVTAADVIRRLLGNLANVGQGIAELRNKYGTGHGKTSGTKGLQTRHAKLVVGAASTLAVFLMETHQERANPDPASGSSQ
ncbi:MAG TPA: abortive infection family protein [Kofleriaceae bacterium]|nr:abortive infection family protein [Kofleriaceae bacterium]